TILCRRQGTSMAVAAAAADMAQVRAATATLNTRLHAAAAAAGSPAPEPNLYVRIPRPPKAATLASAPPLQATAAGSGFVSAAGAAAAPAATVNGTSAVNPLSACLPDATDLAADHLWGLKKIHAPYAWCGREPRAQPHPIPVAILDTGINLTHPNLLGNIDKYR